MSSFEFVFSLFGLLLGFSLAEVLTGAVRTVKSRQKVRVGWLTPMLGVFVLLDLLSFWTGAWNAREVIPVGYATLVYGLTVTGLYYMAAALVFPEAPAEWGSLDDYYWEHRRQVLLAVWMCNNAAFSAIYWLRGAPPNEWIVGIILVYSLLVVAACLSRRLWVNVVALSGLIAVYLLETVGSVIALSNP